MLREQLIAEIAAAARTILHTDDATAPLTPLTVFTPESPASGDFATDVARQLARRERDPSRARPLAEAIAQQLNDWPGGLVESARVGGDDLIHLHLREEALAGVLETIISQGEQYGHADFLAGRRILVEFVSAHPNAPLGLLHGRGGVIGDVLGALFTACGAQVQREYYVNDAEDSRPLRALARAVLARLRQQVGTSAKTDGDGYPDDYVEALADSLRDTLNEQADLKSVQQTLLAAILAQQKEVLDRFGVRFDNWFSENTLQERGEIASITQSLVAAGLASRHADGSLWLHAARFGDEADRALVRSDGTATYLAGDLAYHRDKFARGFDRLVDVWGAEHEMYIPRTRAGIAALGLDPGRLEVVVCHPVRLLQDGIEVRSSSRYDGAPLLEEAIEQVGADAVRFALVLAAPQTPLDIDLDALRSARSPLARICAAAGTAAALPDRTKTTALETPSARALVIRLGEFPRLVARSVDELSPHLLPAYARDIADAFSAIAPDDVPPALGKAVAITLENVLALIGVSDALPITGGGSGARSL